MLIQFATILVSFIVAWQYIMYIRTREKDAEKAFNFFWKPLFYFSSGCYLFILRMNC